MLHFAIWLAINQPYRSWRLSYRAVTRSMSKSIECANSATDKIMKSPFLLRSITTTLSEVPVTPDFGQAPCGADEVSVKNRSESSDCALCSVVELADLPDITTKAIYQQKMQFLPCANVKLALLIKKSVGKLWRHKLCCSVRLSEFNNTCWIKLDEVSVCLK